MDIQRLLCVCYYKILLFYRTTMADLLIGMLDAP